VAPALISIVTLLGLRFGARPRSPRGASPRLRRALAIAASSVGPPGPPTLGPAFAVRRRLLRALAAPFAVFEAFLATRRV